VRGRYRWWIGGLLFASTVINYLDRQTLSVLAPHLKSEFRWSNEDFALLIIAFRVAYTVMQAIAGRLPFEIAQDCRTTIPMVRHCFIAARLW